MKTFTKQIILIFLMMGVTQIGLAQCHSWLDLSSPNPAGISYGAWSVTTDLNNNVYSTGQFTGSVSFGGINLTNPTGGTSFYINKYNSGGVIQWAIQLPVTSYIYPPVICQKDGILYVAGAFADSLVIGSDTIKTTFGYPALFVLKLNLNGNIIGYVPEFGSTDNGVVYTLGITVNSSNDIYLTGRASGNFTFGSVLLNNSSGNYAYLAKFDSGLNTIWAIQANSTYISPRSRGWGITLDNNENVIIGGWFTQEIEFGTQTFNANNNTGGVNPYIAKFDTAGNCQWIRGGEGPQTNFSGPVYTVVSDLSGNIYYAGELDTTMTIDGNTLNPENGTFFYCKYTSTGNLVWVHQAGNTLSSSTGFEAPTSLVIDGSNNMWSGGWTNVPAYFGGFLLSNGYVFIAKLDLDGNFKGVIGGKGLGGSYPSALDSDGNLYVGGMAGGDTISFDSNTTINIIDTTGVDFVLKYCTSEMGIEQLSINNDQISIYPNPTTEKFTIIFPATTRQIQISDLLGEVLQIKYVNNEKSMDFELNDEGIYLIRIKTDKETLSKKLIICK
jgi:hypothetical protein